MQSCGKVAELLGGVKSMNRANQTALGGSLESFVEKLGINSLVQGTSPVAVNVIVTDDKLIIEMEDRRSVAVLLAWYPRLLHGSASERSNWQLLGDGYAIERPDLDEHIGVEALLAGRRSGKSERPLERWRAARSA